MITLNLIAEKAQTIINYVTAPYWEVGRKEKIRELAEEIRKLVLEKLDTDKTVNNIDDEGKDQNEIREAKRVAAIAESMNIMRTLNSNKCEFTAHFRNTEIEFYCDRLDVERFIPPSREYIISRTDHLYTTINFVW